MRTLSLSSYRGFFGKIYKTTVAVLICLTPTWIHVLTKVIQNPEGSWQEIFLIRAEVSVLCGVQVVPLVLLFFYSMFVWMDGDT